MKYSYLKKGIINIFNHKFGKCNICGNYTLFLCSNPLTVRNNMICYSCRSSSRERHIASFILKKLFPELKSISKINNAKSETQIYNLGTDDPFTKQLSNNNFFYQSEYMDNILPGTEINTRLYCQNVEKLTFDNNTFDLVISGDVFEHVRKDFKGFNEISRVLKTGGYHIFTVPCYFDKETINRVDTSTEEDISLLPPQYHGDPNRGKILAYRTYGIDIFKNLSNCGFHTEMFRSNFIDHKNGIFDSYVFVSKKT